MEYYIFVTNNCNLDCKYCSGISITKNTYTSECPTYSLEELKKFVLMCEGKYNSDTIDFVFYGGEPTLNYKYLTDFIDFFGDLINGKKISYILHTNGLLLDKIPLEVLRNLKLILVSINFDKISSQGLNNTYFSKIIDNLKIIKRQHPVKTLARLTITENTSLYSNVIQVSHFFDYVHWQLVNCQQFEDYNSYFENYKYELSLLFDYWLSYFKKGFILNYIPFMTLIRLSLSNEEVNNFLCGFNSFSIYIQTDGRCFMCPEEMNNPEFEIGNVNIGIKFKNYSLDSIRCSSCEFFKTCFGRCGRMHEKFKDNHITEYCNLNKELFKIYMNNKYEILNLVNRQPNLLELLYDKNFMHTECIP